MIGKVSEAGLQASNDIVLGGGASDAVYLLTVLQEDERGDVLHAVTSGESASLVYVHLAYLGHAGHLGSDLVNDGGDHAAGAAPCSPEVHQYRNGGIENLGLEVAFCNL